MSPFEWLVFVGVAAWFLRARLRQNPEGGAKRIQQLTRELFVPEQEYAPARLEDFPHLDAAFYSAITEQAAAQGFVLLGDLENKTVSRKGSGLPTVLRSFSDGNGVSLAAYNFRATGWVKWVVPAMRDVRSVELETELSDGSFIATTNAWASRHVKRPASILVAFHQPSTPAGVLIRDHRRRLEQHLREHPSLHVLENNTLNQLVESARRMDRLKAAFHDGRDHRMTREELRSIASDSRMPGVRQAADQVADAFEGSSGAPQNSSPPSRSPIVRGLLLWLGLVVVFIIYYWLTGSRAIH